jgi:Polyketide cyclase / dehydrase and lipid transport
MKIAITIIVVIIIAVALCAGVIALLGARLPRAHVASRSIVLHQTPATVYRVVREFSKMPEWRPDLKRVVIEERPGEKIHFREEGKSDTVNYELVEDIPTQRIVTRILDTNL